MKSIQISDKTHEHVMGLKTHKRKSADLVIGELVKVHNSEQWKAELRLFCILYDRTDPKTHETLPFVMHMLGSDGEDAISNLPMSDFDNGKFELIKTIAVDVVRCGEAFAITPIEQI